MPNTHSYKSYNFILIITTVFHFIYFFIFFLFWKTSSLWKNYKKDPLIRLRLIVNIQPLRVNIRHYDIQPDTSTFLS